MAGMLTPFSESLVNMFYYLNPAQTPKELLWHYCGSPSPTFAILLSTLALSGCLVSSKNGFTKAF